MDECGSDETNTLIVKKKSPNVRGPYCTLTLPQKNNNLLKCTQYRKVIPLPYV